MLTNANEFVELWEPRVGRDAALLRWASARLLLMGWLLNFIWIPLIIAGAKASVPSLTWIGAVVACVEAGCIVLAGLKLRAANRLTSHMLGLKVGFRATNPPPRTADRYEAWCRKHGVVPYGAASRHATEPDMPRDGRTN